MYRDILSIVMEADDDELQPFDPGDAGEAMPVEAAPEPPTDDDMGGAEPPPIANDGDDLSMGDDGGFGADAESGDVAEDGEKQDGSDAEKKVSEKASAILNQKLYKQLQNRNKEIRDILENLQTIVPLLPYEVVSQNDQLLSQLKTSLSKGQTYAVEKFLDSDYGENLLFFQKLDSLYKLILGKLDKNLKKIENSD